MADNKTTIEVSIQAAEAAKTIQELKKSLKDLVNQQANVSAGSAEWKKLTQAINDTEGKIGDLTDSFKTLQGSGVDRVSSSFNLFKEGLTSFDFGKIGTALKGLGAAFKAIPIFLVVEAISYLVENFKELSQGSGLLAKALQAVGKVMDFIKTMGNEVADALGLISLEVEQLSNKLDEFTQTATKQIESFIAEYDRSLAILRAAGADTVSMEIKKQQFIIATNKLIVEQTVALVAAGATLTEEQNKQLAVALNNIKNATTQIDVIRLEQDKKEREENKKKAEKQAELNKKRLEEEKKLRDEIAAYNRAAVAENQKIDNDEAIAKANLRLARNQDDINAKINLLKVQKDIELQNAELTASARKLIEQKYINDVEALKKEARDKELKEIEENNKKINDLDNKNLLAGAELRALQNQNDLDAQLAFLETKKQLELENKELTENEKALIEERYRIDKENKTKEFAEREKQANFAATAQALQMAQQSLAATQALSDLYFDQKLKKAKGDEKATLEIQKRQFKVNKALAINNALIGTAQSIVQALSSLPPPASYIFAGISAATGAIQVAKIASSKFEGGEGGGSAPSMSTPTPSIPSPPTISTPTNNISGTQFDAQGNTITPQAQQPTITVKAQVVESDMTDTQNTVTKYKAQSTF